MTETQKEIRQRILHAADHKAQLQSSQSFFSTNSIVNISLGVLVIFLTIAMFVVMHNKNNSRVMVTSPVQQKVDTSHLVSKAEVQSKLDVVDKKIDTIDQRLAVVFRKIWLLGLVTNENASIQRKAGNGDFIYFDEDWKMSHMPKTIGLNEEQKEKLKEHVK